MLLSVGGHTSEDKYANTSVCYSRSTATAKQLEVDFSIVTLPGHIWENIRYSGTIIFISFFSVTCHNVYKSRWTVLPHYLAFLKDQ